MTRVYVLLREVSDYTETCEECAAPIRVIQDGHELVEVTDSEPAARVALSQGKAHRVEVWEPGGQGCVEVWP